jgi:hypothetical protein
VSTLNIEPPKLALLAILGFGAYYLVTRRAIAGNASGGAAAVGRAFFVSPSTAGDTLEQQAATAARNGALMGGLLGFLQPKLQPSVTSALPSAYRQAEKASYDLASPIDGLTTGDFARMDRAALANDSIVANGPGYADPYDFSREYWY